MYVNIYVLILLLVIIVLLSLSLYIGSRRQQRLWRQDIGQQTEIIRQAQLADLGLARSELSQEIKLLESELISKQIEITKLQTQQADNLSRSIESWLQSGHAHLMHLRQDNDVQLKEMRALVEDKLQQTLEARLTESFQIVSQQLQTVHSGLGEMKNLAADVHALNKVMNNVKTRGIWGEAQLENILREILVPEQYQCNVATRPGSSERVEFALKLPGQHGAETVWLPIDAKFPQEDYLRMIEAENAGDLAAAQEFGLQLEKRIRLEARAITSKYIEPPFTTDFALLFVPTESLYAEISRRSDLLAQLQRDYRVTIVGPNTLAATLNALAVGFRTLTIEARSNEVWRLLIKVKSEFERLATLLDKTQKKLQETSNTVENAHRKSRTIMKSLQEVTVADDLNPLSHGD